VADTGDLCYSAPRFEEKQISPVSTRDAAAGLTLKGRWTDLDVWVMVPSTWAGVVTANVYAVCRGDRMLLAAFPVSNAPLSNGSRIGIVGGIRGHLCDGFEVELATSGLGLAKGYVRAYAWGDTSSAPAVVQGASGPLSATVDISTQNNVTPPSSVLPVGAFTFLYDAISPWAAAVSGFGSIQKFTGVTGMQNVIPVVTYNNPALALLNGDSVGLQGMSDGSLRVTEQQIPQAEDNTNNVIAVAYKAHANGAYSPSTSKGLASVSLNVKGTAGVLLSAAGNNENAAQRYFQIKDKATALAGADVPDITIRVAANQGILLGADIFTRAGFKCLTGIQIGWSTTRDTYTAATAAEHTIQAAFV
jgi:hypothetical protein